LEKANNQLIQSSETSVTEILINFLKATLEILSKKFEPIFNAVLKSLANARQISSNLLQIKEESILIHLLVYFVESLKKDGPLRKMFTKTFNSKSFHLSIETGVEFIFKGICKFIDSDEIKQTLYNRIQPENISSILFGLIGDLDNLEEFDSILDKITSSLIPHIKSTSADTLIREIAYFLKNDATISALLALSGTLPEANLMIFLESQNEKWSQLQNHNLHENQIPLQDDKNILIIEDFDLVTNDPKQIDQVNNSIINHDINEDFS
jgi:hypothetical protein